MEARPATSTNGKSESGEGPTRHGSGPLAPMRTIKDQKKYTITQSIQYTGYRVQYTGYRVQGHVPSILGPVYRVLGYIPSIQGTRVYTQYTVYSIQGTRVYTKYTVYRVQGYKGKRGTRAKGKRVRVV